MDRHKFDPKCPGCRPAVLDPKTGKVLPPNDPVMVAVNTVWDSSSLEEQEAYHRVMVYNSRDPKDLILLKAISDRIQAI